MSHPQRQTGVKERKRAMNVTSLRIALLTVAGTAVAANAQVAGDVVVSDLNSDSILLIEKDGGSMSSLLSFDDPDTRLAGLATDGTTWWVASGPTPIQQPSTAEVLRIDDLFGVPSTSVLASSDPIQNPIGMRYDAASGQLITINNPGAAIMDTRFHGILSVDAATGDVVQSFEHPPFDTPGPVFQNGTRLVSDPFSTDYFVSVTNGGEFSEGDGPDDEGSQIYRYSLDPDTLAGDVVLWADLSDVGFTGLDEPMSFARGVTVDPATGDVYASDSEDGLIIRISQNGDGTAGDVSVITDDFPGVGTLAFNQFTDRLVFSTLGNFADDEVWSINLDGSDPILLAEGVEARDIVVIPTPASTTLLGVATLLAVRRRRG